MKKLFLIPLFFTIAARAQTQMPLVEYFTNTACANCPAWSDALEKALTNVGRSNVAVIQYHNANPSPTDPFYLDNTQESGDRTSYYGVIGDPAIAIDGSSLSSSNYIQFAIQNEMQKATSLSLTLSGMRSGRSGNVNVAVSGSAPGGWKLFAAVTETGRTYHGTNGEIIQNDIFRETLTSWAGVDASAGSAQLPFTLGAGKDSDLYPNDTTPWVFDSCRIVVWAQNVQTKAVYQSAQIWVRDLATAPSFQFTTADTLLAAPPESDDITAIGWLTNTGDSPITINAIRTANALPANWSTAICLMYCAAPFVDTLSVSDLQPGAQQIFILHFDPDATPGAATVTMKFAASSDTASGIVQRFHFRTNDLFHSFTSPTYRQVLSASGPDTIRWSGDSESVGRAPLYYSSNDTDWVFIDSVSYGLGGGEYVWNPGFHAAVYNVRLRLDLYGEGVLSPLFNLAPTAVSEPLPLSYALKCMPNPANGSATIIVNGYATRRIALFDALGRIVMSSPLLGASRYSSVTINTSGLEQGLYFVRAYTASYYLSAPLLVVH